MIYKPLRITHHQSRPLIWWFRSRANIDMDPPYQRRGKLWSPSDKAYLIDSIINGYDIPKLYVADFQMGESELNSKRLPYAIIDGKQRFEAVFDFFLGNIVLNPDFVWRQDPSLKLGGLSIRELRTSYPSVSDLFEAGNFDVMSVMTSDEAEINELFVRLNRSKPLTGAEIRNAMVGPVPEISRNISKHEFFLQSIRFSVKRAADQNAAAKLLWFEYSNKLQSTKKKDLDQFAKDDSIVISSVELAGRRVIDVLDQMQEIFLPRDELLGSAGIIPVYYWLVRQAASNQHRFIREFLVRFEFRRKRHRLMQVSSSEDADPIFARFDALNRSTNDIGSHVGRYEILRDEFAEWRNENGYV